ncbi:MAG: BatD family protein [Thermodesulfobacteriota bacterium]|nr:BatD family protein [Thermodesulfobacteriota bacterium]
MKKTLVFVMTMLVLTGIILTAMPALASDVSVGLELDRDETTTADQVKMVISVSGVRSMDRHPLISGLDSFDIASSGTSSRIEIINRKKTVSLDYTYYIRPQKTGTFHVGPAEIEVDGRTYKSGTQTLVVRKVSAASGPNRQGPFLRAELSSKKVYEEEPLIYTLKLFYTDRVSDLSLNPPDVDGLTFKQASKASQYTGVYNGRSYHVIEVRYSVVPEKPGLYGVGASRMDLVSYDSENRRSTNGFFANDPFFSRSNGRRIQIKSDSIDLEVSPLPLKGRPDGFSGLVGRFRIVSKLDPARIKAGDSASLIVTISGRGNVKRIPDIKGPGFTHIKVYADQPDLKVQRGPQGPEGTKTMKWAMVPEKPGKYRIPPYSLTFFDTKKGAYREIKTRPLELDVRESASGQPPLVSSGHTQSKGPGGKNKRQVKEIGHDILPVHTALSKGAHIPGPVLLWLLLLGPVAVYLIVVSIVRARKKTMENISGQRAKKALKRLVQRSKDPGIGAGDLMDIVRGYFNDRFDMSLGTLTPGQAGAILRSRGVDNALIDSLEGELNALFDRVYTGRGDAPCDKNKDIAGLFREIERGLG